MEHPSTLFPALVLAVVASSVAFATDVGRRLVAAGLDRRATLVVLVPWGAVAVAFSVVPALRATLEVTFPFGLGAGLALAFGAASRPSARAALERLGDSDIRALLGWRAVFGGLLLGLGAVGRLPLAFAWSAGLGDLAVAWLGQLAPGRLGPAPLAGRWAAVVAALGVLDLAHVLWLAVTVVRPWAEATGIEVSLVVLPWWGVPMFLAGQAGLLVAALRPSPAPA